MFNGIKGGTSRKLATLVKDSLYSQSILLGPFWLDTKLNKLLVKKVNILGIG